MVIHNSTGQFKEKQKEAGEGFTAEEWEMNDKKGVTYCKYHNTLSGILSKMELVSPPYNENLLELRIYLDQGDDVVSVLSVPYMDFKGDWLSDWVVALAPIVHGLKKGIDVEFSLNKTKKDKSERLYKSIYAKVDGENIGLEYTYNDAPRWKMEKSVHKVTKKETTVVDKEEHDLFIVDKIDKALASFTHEPTETTTSPKTTESKLVAAPKTEAKTPEKKPVEVEDDSDDLPFG
ncbi:MAG: hypothetical protein WD512_02980 [Candidatus Paceibacterota bacterium]